MRKTLVISFFLFLTVFVSGQIRNPVRWETHINRISTDTLELVFRASIESPWHMYGVNIPEGGPIATSVVFDSTGAFYSTGATSQMPEPEIIDDKIFNMQLELHSGDVVFSQKIVRYTDESFEVTGTVEYMTCSDMECVLGGYDFSFNLDGEGNLVSDEALAGDVSQPAARSVFNTLLLSLLAGLGGLLTPCVYPMIPLTVAYFMRGNQNRKKAVAGALTFGLSIILIYTLIGVLVAVFKNPNAVNNVTTHWAVNMIFFLIFIALSLSFFGMYEITLPSGLANRVDRQADRGGYAGAFFMALAMVILSFSCTGPIVASLLIKASSGEVIEPVIGMAGFSLVFALPFTLFAIFPSWLEKLPKSGSWLNSVKVFFAFIMLAFAFYFISKIDQVYHLNLLSRELFLSIWIVIFGTMGLYYLGIIRFAHDSPLPFLGVPRFMFSLASLAFAVYLVTGFSDNSLKALDTILPPVSTGNTAVITTGPPDNPAGGSVISAECANPLYADFLSLPHGLTGYFDYEQALACAAGQGKPVLVDFVGHTCSNCKKMYAEVWSDPRVLEKLKNDFIVVALYTDDKTKLPESEWVTSAVDGKVKNTIGKVNQDIQISRFDSNALPLYAIVDAEGKSLTNSFYTYNPEVQAFLDWLDEGSENAPVRQINPMIFYQ